MRIPRIYQAVPLKLEETISLDSQATTHVVRVLRLKLDDRIIIFNGEGGEYAGVLVQADKRAVLVKLVEYRDPQNESPLHTVLLQGVSRGERMDYALQKSVELGVSEIYPVMTKYTSVQLKDDRKQKKQMHWQGVVQSACEQSGRNRVPVVHAVDSLGSWLGNFVVEDYDLCLVLNHRTSQSITKLEKPRQPKVVLIAGPEGGLSEEEIAFLESKKFVSVNLGPRVLRTETAALAAISIMQSMWGDFN